MISKSKNGLIPIPSHFNTKDFVVAAFDNSDYKDKSSLTDPKEEHNTAIVLFQDINLPQNLDRGKVSDLVNINIAKRQYIQDLDCQKILSYYLPKEHLPLPLGFVSKDFIYERDSSEKCLSIVKNAIASEILSDTPTWSGCHSLVSSNILSTKKAGFIPVIPNPITKAETVYTCLINFKKISSTLKQKTLPIFCDEGVYQYTTQIYLHKPELFDDILVLMGAFHTAKAAMKCAGKFLRGCGVEDTFIECLSQIQMKQC